MSCLQAEGTAPGVDELKAHDPETLAEALAEKIQEVRLTGVYNAIAAFSWIDSIMTALLTIMQVEEYKDRLARALADMENMRERTMRQAEREKQFAVSVSSWPSYPQASMHAWADTLARCRVLLWTISPAAT